MIEADTFEVFIQGRQSAIGLIGVEAPQGNTSCGKQAIGFAQQLLRSGQVRFEEDPDIKYDKRTRRMYYAVLPGARSMASELVRGGFGRARNEGKEANALIGAEDSARSAAAGCLWGPFANLSAPNLAAPNERFNEHAVEGQPKRDTAGPAAITYPNGFSQEVVASGFTNPTGLAFLPDGRILVTEKAGVVKVIKNGAVLPTPFIDIRDRVNDYWDHGLLGIAPDANFSTNNLVFLLYTYEDNPANYNGTKTARLTRVTATGDTASPFSEVIILGTTTGSSCNNFPVTADCMPSDGVTHSIGSVRVAADGTLFISEGDGANFNVVENDAYRSQNLDSLAGKILHVTTDGRGIPTNPFWNGDATANRSKVFAYGLRNPFRFNLRPATTTPYIGDVGWDTWEEANVGSPGANFGWPCYEGNFQQSGYAPGAVCQSLFAQGPSAVKFGIVSWNHIGSSAASIGGAFFTGPSYPAQYQGAYFYADYGQNVIRYLTVDANNNLVSGPTQFASSADSPVAIEMGPDGMLYFVSIATGQVRRIRFTSGNTPPTAAASGAPTAGLAPLNVQFSSAGSSDPNNDPLSYSWNFGDGSAVSTAANPTHTYTANGTYTATLTVSDGRGGTGTATVTITAGNRAPTATITAPASSLLFKVGDTINYSGSGTDPEDGALAPARLSWQVILHHCPGGVCHIHPLSSSTGATGSFVAPDHGDSSYFEIVLTATDSGGLTATASVNIQPQTVQITLNTVPTGLQVVYGGESGPSPLVRTTIVGSAHTITAPSPQSALGATLTFAGWSDGGAQQHNVTVGTSPVTFTATYSSSFAPIRVNCGGNEYRDPLGQTWVADTGFSAGVTYSVTANIANTNTPTLYQSERWDSGTFQYQFTVPNGSYTVNLKFAELFETAAGRRVFNVNVNGQAALTNFDIFALAGGNTALDRSIGVNVTGGTITIEFVPLISNPKINAIEIVPSTGVNVSVSPPAASLHESQTQQFSATVTGSPNTSVTWSITPPGVGSISSGGLYTAPATISGSQQVSVKATSVADNTRSGTATLSLSPAPTGFTPIRVNAGGSAYTDSAGQTWAADTGFSAGAAYTTGANITNTNDPTLYRSERWNGSTFQYQFSVPAGNYTVRLLFAEIYYTSAGQRVFNINLNGSPVRTNFDVFAAAGAANRAIDQIFTTSSTGTITIQLVPVVANPKINGIEIVQTSGIAVTVSPGSASLTASQTQQFSATVTGTSNTAVTWSLIPSVGTITSAGLYTAPASITTSQTITVKATSNADNTTAATAIVTLTPPASATPIRVNAGGPAVTDSSGLLWSADTGFSGGAAYSTTSTITGTTSPALYQTERWNSTTLSYAFTVPAATYTVTLKFAEIYNSGAGQRVFNIRINGNPVATNFDIYALAGAKNAALDRSFSVAHPGGQLQIDFVPVVSNPKISAIEIK